MLARMGLLFVVIVIVGSRTIEAQQTNKHHSESWNIHGKDRFLLRTGIGYEKSFYRELGLAYGVSSLYDLDSAHESAIHTAVYSSFLSRLSTFENRPLYGVRLGVEGSNLLLSEAFELSYFWNNPYSKNVLVCTPKIGLNVMGLLGIYYGYNLYTKQSEFKPMIGHHQISISSLVCISTASRKFWKSL